jgi:hypothetical protein
MRSARPVDQGPNAKSKGQCCHLRSLFGSFALFVSAKAKVLLPKRTDRSSTSDRKIGNETLKDIPCRLWLAKKSEHSGTNDN